MEKVTPDHKQDTQLADLTCAQRNAGTSLRRRLDKEEKVKEINKSVLSYDISSLEKYPRVEL